MKFKLFPLLAGAIASASIAFALPANAQFADNPQWEEKKQEVIETLGLTETQQSQLAALRSDMRSQMEGILTEEQKATLQSAISGGQNPRQAMRSLNFTEAQREQMRSARQDFRTELQTILSEEQLQQLRQMMQSRRGNRR